MKKISIQQMENVSGGSFFEGTFVNALCVGHAAGSIAVGGLVLLGLAGPIGWGMATFKLAASTACLIYSL